MKHYCIENSAGQIFLYVHCCGGAYFTLIADSWDEIKKYANQLHIEGFADGKE